MPIISKLAVSRNLDTSKVSGTIDEFINGLTADPRISIKDVKLTVTNDRYYAAVYAYVIYEDVPFGTPAPVVTNA